jgi:hypothetical protein
MTIPSTAASNIDDVIAASLTPFYQDIATAKWCDRRGIFT